jgi:hypothetical protein
LISIGIFIKQNDVFIFIFSSICLCSFLELIIIINFRFESTLCKFLLFLLFFKLLCFKTFYIMGWKIFKQFFFFICFCLFCIITHWFLFYLILMLYYLSLSVKFRITKNDLTWKLSWSVWSTLITHFKRNNLILNIDNTIIFSKKFTLSFL